MRTVNTQQIEDAVYNLALKACRELTPSCRAAIENSANGESDKLAKFSLNVICENEKIAKERSLPVCQDTGLSVVFIEIGQEVYLEGKLVFEAVNDGVRRAYKDGCFRKSCCDPLTRVNTADNTPAVLHTEIVAGDRIKITFLPKGFGSENMSKLYMLTPAQGVDGIIDVIVETVKVAGSRPCPPVYVGVGIGSTFDGCALLAKKALMRPVGEHNEREDVKQIELAALERINALNIGPQGFGGNTTAIGVSVVAAPTHIAGLPVAVNIQCHCVRSAETTI